MLRYCLAMAAGADIRPYEYDCRTQECLLDCGWHHPSKMFSSEPIQSSSNHPRFWAKYPELLRHSPCCPPLFLIQPCHGKSQTYTPEIIENSTACYYRPQSRHIMYLVASVRLTVCLSVRPSVNALTADLVSMKAWKCHFRHEFSEKFSDQFRVK